jgi:hypothetical protein
MTDDTPAEPSFLHRRFYTYAGGMIYAALIATIIVRLAEPGPLKWIALALIAANAAREAFYMGGASLADWAMVTKAWRRGS